MSSLRITKIIIILLATITGLSLTSCQNKGPNKEMTILIFQDTEGNPIQATDISYSVVEAVGSGGKMSDGKTDASGVYRSGVSRYQSLPVNIEQLNFKACKQSFKVSEQIFHGYYPDPKSITAMITTLSAKNIPTAILKGIKVGVSSLLSTEKALWISVGIITVDCESGEAWAEEP